MRNRLVIAASAFILWLGCQGKLLTISVEESASTSIEEGTLLEDLVGDIGFDEFLNMDITASTELQNQGVNPGDIQDVQFVYFELEALEPLGADLSFIESMELYVEAPGLDEILVASQDNFPEGQALVEFDIEEADLTDYVVSQSMTFSTVVSGHRPSDTTEVEARFKVDVGVTAQGACNSIKGGDDE